MSAGFVVLEHQTPDGTHWDLMIPFGEVLWTWRMGCPPGLVGGSPIQLQKIVDHPLRFLNYEGPVQNGAGSVTIRDRGTFELVAQTSASLSVLFSGRHLKGTFHLRQTETPSFWLMERSGD